MLRPLARSASRALLLVSSGLTACSDAAPASGGATPAAPIATAAPVAPLAPAAPSPVPAPQAPSAPSSATEGAADTAEAIVGGVGLDDARRLARTGDHAGAIAALDRALAAAPTDVHALALRGHQTLFVDGGAARARARADLERARTLAGDDATLASAIEFNLGLLDDREGRGERARAHYAEANRLRPSSRAREHAEGRRACSLEITVEAAPRDLVGTYQEAAALAYRAIDVEPEEDPSDDDARAVLCGPTTPCPTGEPVVGLAGDLDQSYANFLVPLPTGRMRVLPGLLHTSREYQCSPALRGEVVSRGPWVALRAVSTENTAVGTDERGRDCDADEDADCTRACLWSRQSVADVLVRTRDGLAVTVVAAAPTPDDRTGEGRIAAYHQVELTRSATGVRVVGCGVDRVVPLPE